MDQLVGTNSACVFGAKDYRGSTAVVVLLHNDEGFGLSVDGYLDFDAGWSRGGRADMEFATQPAMGFIEKMDVGDFDGWGRIFVGGANG
ncbi:hypothetical protein CKO27_22015 [Thiocystis violacea]|nr:hypothetical protein [Thiocystis violacea]